MTIWAEEARLAGRGLRQTQGAPGLFGGGAGKTGRFVLHADSDEERRLPGAFSELAIDPGTTVRVETPSGAGYGSPLERDPALVLADVIAGKVSADAASPDYGVVLANGTVNAKKTAQLRLSRQQEGSTHGG